MLTTALFGGRQEAFKAESAGALTGDAQRGDDRAGTGNGAYGDACLGTLLHQIFAGIRDGGAAGIRNQSAGLTGEDPLYNKITLTGLVMLIVADEAFFDAHMIQQLQRDAGIFRGDEVRLLQRLPAAGRDVAQVTNGGGYQI